MVVGLNTMTLNENHHHFLQQIVKVKLNLVKIGHGGKLNEKVNQSDGFVTKMMPLLYVINLDVVANVVAAVVANAADANTADANVVTSVVANVVTSVVANAADANVVTSVVANAAVANAAVANVPDANVVTSVNIKLLIE